MAMHQPPPSPANERTNNHDATCAEVMTVAEHGLAAFISAVTELFGSEQARLSAEDWLDELESMNSLPGSTRRDWRMVTVGASARLASRLTAGLRLRRPPVASADTKGFAL
ncbi:MAG: hypothetical protein ACREHV_15725 [Rhizomicrobium sp.]